MGDETPHSGGSEAAPRPPTLNDLARLGAELNRLGARYVVVGGLAILQAGYFRGTEDVDLLVETGVENEARVIQALLILPDQAARELKPGEVGEFGVVRVADEIIVDLMKSGCDVTYTDAIQDAVHVEIEGVNMPFASPRTLWRMKQTVREKDIPDRIFLQRLLKAQGVDVGSAGSPPGALFAGWWRRMKVWWRGSNQ